METQTIESGKYTGALHDLIDIFIEHNFTVKEAQIFLQSPDILSDMMQQFMAPQVAKDMWPGKVLIKEILTCGWPPHVLTFIKERYPTYGFLLDCINHRETDRIYISPMQRREIYDQYNHWSAKQSMRPLSRDRFYETLQSLNFRIRHGLKKKNQGLTEASPSVSLIR